MRKKMFPKTLQSIREIFGLGPMLALLAILLVALVGIFSALWFIDTAPPDTITLIAGPKDSEFQRHAEAYRRILARNGVKLNIIPSQGSLENLVHLSDPGFHIDVGFVQGGLLQGGVLQGLNTEQLVSLGSIFYEPMMVFYRGETAIDRLSRFNGKRLAIGTVSSGTHALASALLKANGIESGGATELLEMDADEAATELLANRIDAVFVMGDSASLQLISGLLHAPGIRLMSFAQAEAYTRNIVYLNKLELSAGAIDLGQNIPEQNVLLLAPTVELVARSGLHPALSDLLLEAAHEVHGSAGLLQQRGEFPAALEHEFRISEEARRYYTSGKSFLYRNLPFWLATLVSRILMVIVPIIVVLIPGLRLLPPLYRWNIRRRIARWYGALLELERGLLAKCTPEQQVALLKRLDDIERAVNKMKVPKSFGDQFYGLRQHIGFVRERLLRQV
ncbi:MAG: ABC transporter substrate-binding protein [Nitrosomonadales bacterium]|nr:ABC transporter substrate-binding protein [Nitrosomonadales bacterium]